VHEKPILKYFKPIEMGKVSTIQGKIMTEKNTLKSAILNSINKETDDEEEKPQESEEQVPGGKIFEYRKFILLSLGSDLKVNVEMEFVHPYKQAFDTPDEFGVIQRLYFNEDLSQMF